MVHKGPFRFWTDISARDPHADIDSAHLGQLSLWLYSKGLRSWTIWSGWSWSFSFSIRYRGRCVGSDIGWSGSIDGASLGHSDSAADRSACDWSSGPHADIGFVAGGPIMFLYMPIDDRTSLSVSSVMAVGFGIGSPMEGRPDLIRSVSSLRDSAEVSPPGSRPMA